jgi:hypothetical protein
MKQLIEKIKAKADSLGVSRKEDRRVKGVYVDCLLMVEDSFKELDDILEDAEHIASLMDNGRSNHSLGESQGFENGAQWVIDAIKARM